MTKMLTTLPAQCLPPHELASLASASLPPARRNLLAFSSAMFASGLSAGPP